MVELNFYERERKRKLRRTIILLSTIIIVGIVGYFLLKQVSGTQALFKKNITGGNITASARIYKPTVKQYPYQSDYIQSCAAMDIAGEVNNIYNIKQKLCREFCGNKVMEYSSNSCKADRLYCSCKG